MQDLNVLEEYFKINGRVAFFASSRTKGNHCSSFINIKNDQAMKNTAIYVFHFSNLTTLAFTVYYPVHMIFHYCRSTAGYWRATDMSKFIYGGPNDLFLPSQHSLIVILWEIAEFKWFTRTETDGSFT